MFRQMLALVLIAVLQFSQLALADHTQKIEKQARKVAGDQVVRVHLKSGREARGRIGPCFEQNFTLHADAGDEQLSYQDVRSIEKVKPPRSKRGWKIAAGVAVGVVIALGVLVWSNREISVW